MSVRVPFNCSFCHVSAKTALLLITGRGCRYLRCVHRRLRRSRQAVACQEFGASRAYRTAWRLVHMRSVQLMSLFLSPDELRRATGKRRFKAL